MFDDVDVDEATRLLRHVDAVRRAPSERATLQQAISEIGRLRAWLDGCEADLAAALVSRTPLPTRDLAKAGRISERAADKVIERADTAASIPELAAGMAAGDISGGHIDAVTASIKSLKPQQRSLLRARAGQLAAKAATSTVEEFRSLVQAEARNIMEDDGVDRLERQKRGCRLRTWTDRESGMWRISGAFDPETGLKLSGRLDNAVATLFAEAVPDTAPDDPGERADHLRALALVALTEGRVGSSGRAEIIAVVHEYAPDPNPAASTATDTSPHRGTDTGTDTGTDSGAAADNGTGTESGSGSGAWAGSGSRLGPGSGSGSGSGVGFDADDGAGAGRRDGTATDSGDRRNRPDVDWGLPVELPWEALVRLMNSDTSDVHGIVIRNGIVIHAPGQLDLGRTTRLASKAQRRALRAMYSTCAVPGCCVRFQYTNAHHVIWWERGGRTDIGNLIPLCSKHHHLAHEGRWHFHLDAERNLTITLPDGTRMTNAPPHRHRRAA